MLIDSYNRQIDYARISLTDRCSLRCRYCMPEHDYAYENHILEYAELHQIISLLEELGIKKIRFTGGEPLIRPGVMRFFQSLEKEFYLTSCLAIEHFDADALNATLIKGINVSLDTLEEDKYKWLTRGGDLNVVLSNISKIKIKNLKLNMVLIADFNEDEIFKMIDFADSIGAVLRFIEKMDFADNTEGFVSSLNIRNKLIACNIIEQEAMEHGSSAARYYKLKSKKGHIGFITALSDSFCLSCNRIRIQSNGILKNCLFEESFFNIRDILKSSCSREDIKKAIKNQVKLKPEKACVKYTNEDMVRIGG